MEVAVHQVQWEREDEHEPKEEEEKEELLTSRPETVDTAFDLSDLINGDAVQNTSEEKEQGGSNFSDDLPLLENGKSEEELSVPENGKSSEELSVLENGKSNDELSVPESGKSKDEVFVPDSNDELSIPENGESVPENGKSNDELSEPENGKSKDELLATENGQLQGSDNEENGYVQCTIINNQYQENSKDDSLTDKKLLPAEKPVEDREITQSSRDVTVNGVDAEVLKEEELNDLDVERVLKEQNTHDLFCPNCHSCITRRVILRKRKRSLKISDEDGKRNKPEIVEDSHLDIISEHTTDNQINTSVDSSSQTPAAYEYNRDTEPDVFRCLSCFTFFIPTGDGFKLFGNKKEKENLQCEQTSSGKKNWFSSLFASRKEEMVVDKDVAENIVVASRQEIDSSPSPLIVNSSSEGPEVTGKIVENRGEKSDGEQKEATEAQLPGKVPLQGEVSEEKTTFTPQQDEVKIFVEPAKEASGFKKSQPDQKLSTGIGNKGTDDKDWLFPGSLSVYGESENNKKKDLLADSPSQNGQYFEVKQALPTQSTVQVQNVGVTFSDSSYSYPSGVSHSNVGTKVDIHIEKAQIANADASSPSLTTSLLLPNTRVVNTAKDLMGVSENTSTGGDTIINIVTERPAQTVTFQQAQDVIASERTSFSSLTERDEEREFRGVEVIKSIVYGGLVETVTSLGIVSSAAGSDTAIINIVALGLANLFGGLFIIFHSLWDLKRDDYGVVSNQVTESAPNQRTQRIDKYRDLLGRRENFYLHATVAILSYIIFGALPPVVYGFSFRQSNDRYYKLLTVSAASFICIAVLSLGKAYVQRPPKPYVKTVFYYVALGFMASGVSYVAGDLMKTWIDKLGWLNSVSDLSVPIMRKSPVETGWNSY